MRRTPGIYRCFAAALFLTPAVGVLAQDGLADPAFSGTHFNQWFEESAPARTGPIKWTASVAEARLSTHQRLFSRIDFKVEKEELARRRDKGQLLFMTQLTDERGVVWRHHSAVGPGGAAKGNEQPFIQPFFVLPGDYAISLAILDAESGQHSVLRRKLHVARLKNDPLPAAWRDLPAVEFLTPGESPDMFFLPEIHGRLHLPVSTERAVQIDLMANFTPSERFSGSTRIQDMTMEMLLPSLKVLSQIEPDTVPKPNLEMLDLARNRVVYRRDNISDNDWTEALGAIGKNSPGIIDVKSLARHRHSAEFFVREIGRRATAPLSGREARAIIVLTSSVTFKPGVDLRPLDVSPPRGVKVFYLRYQPLIAPRARTTAPGAMPPAGFFNPPEVDQLEPLLKDLNPQLFKFTTAVQFRRALAQVMTAIAAM